MLGRKSREKGFTLIELLVVMAIVGILAATAIVNTGRNDDRDARLEADKFSTFLRDVQNMSLSMEKVSGATGKVCGFGIYRSSDTELRAYYVQTSQDNDCSAVTKSYPGDSYIVSRHYMGNGVTIGSFTNGTDIFFLSPNGEVYADPVSTLLGSDTLGFSFTKGTAILTDVIHLSGSGRIY